MFEPLADTPQIERDPERRLLSGSRIAIAAVAFALAALGGYAVHEHSVAAAAAAQNAAISASLKNTNAQVEQLTAKLNEVSAPKPQPADALAKSNPVLRAKPSANAGHKLAAHHAVRDDPRWQKVQSQLDEQGRVIASTRQDLSSARSDLQGSIARSHDELQGSIARTHDELVVLQRKGERRYYEFNIQKSKQFNRAGNMSIRLRKSDAKHQYADLDLLVDDRAVTKKHVNLYEPAMFYATDNDQPAQVVINNISKDHIRGYVSEPKYGKAELSAQTSVSAPKDTEATGARDSSPTLHQRAKPANN